jgi:hypothetical protein
MAVYNVADLQNQYGSNYMKGIQEAQKSGNTALANALTGLRNEKIASSADLQAKYTPTQPIQPVSQPKPVVNATSNVINQMTTKPSVSNTISPAATSVSNLVKSGQVTPPKPVTGGATAPVSPTPFINVPMENTPSEIELRDYATQKGVSVGYNPTTGMITLNNALIANPAGYGLTLRNGRYYGSKESIDNLISMFLKPQVDESLIETTQQDLLKPFLDENTKLKSELAALKEQITQNFDADKLKNEQLFNQIQNFQQYNSPYQQYIDQMAPNLLNQYNQEFKYDPMTDEALKSAQNQVSLATREEAARRGALYGDTAQSMVAQEMGKLAPQFEDKAYQRYADKFAKQMQIANLVLQLDSEAYRRNTDKLTQMKDLLEISRNLSKEDREYLASIKADVVNERTMNNQERTAALQQYNQDITTAFQRSELTGVVDNEASKILGIMPGTFTAAAKQAAIDLINSNSQEIARIEAQSKAAEQQFKNELKVLDITQKYDTTQKQKDRDFEATQKQKEREFQASESQKDRNFQASENSKNRAATAARSSGSSGSSKGSGGSTKLTADDKKQLYNQIYLFYKDQPAKVAKQYLEEDEEKLIKELNPDGYKKLWNQVFDVAINTYNQKDYDRFGIMKKEKTTSSSDSFVKAFLNP